MQFNYHLPSLQSKFIYRKSTYFPTQPCQFGKLIGVNFATYNGRTSKIIEMIKSSVLSNFINTVIFTVNVKWSVATTPICGRWRTSGGLEGPEKNGVVIDQYSHDIHNLCLQNIAVSWRFFTTDLTKYIIFFFYFRAEETIYFFDEP